MKKKKKVPTIWYSIDNKLKAGSVSLTAKTGKEHMFQILFCAYYEQHFKLKKPKNMVKYLKKYHPMLYKRFENDKQVREMFNCKRKG